MHLSAHCLRHIPLKFPWRSKQDVSIFTYILAAVSVHFIYLMGSASASEELQGATYFVVTSSKSAFPIHCILLVPHYNDTEGVSHILSYHRPGFVSEYVHKRALQPIPPI